MSKAKRILSGQAYLDFLRASWKLFKLTKARVKITGKFIF